MTCFRLKYGLYKNNTENSYDILYEKLDLFLAQYEYKEKYFLVRIRNVNINTHTKITVCYYDYRPCQNRRSVIRQAPADLALNVLKPFPSGSANQFLPYCLTVKVEIDLAKVHEENYFLVFIVYERLETEARSSITVIKTGRVCRVAK